MWPWEAFNWGAFWAMVAAGIVLLIPSAVLLNIAVAEIVGELRALRQEDETEPRSHVMPLPD